MNHARGGLGFVGPYACGEDVTGLPRGLRALCNPFLGPWPLSHAQPGALVLLNRFQHSLLSGNCPVSMAAAGAVGTAA